jgi:cytochrome c oxidase subunit II
MSFVRRAPPVGAAAVTSRPPLPVPGQRFLLLSLVPALCLLVSGCEGPLSTLTPSGSGAARVATLFYVMITVAALVWLSVMALAIYAARKAPSRDSERIGRKLILFGGVLLPVVLLGTLSWWSFGLTNELLEPGDGLVVDVTGERFWWRVQYQTQSGPVLSANEIRMPLGERVEFRVRSTDVIHSFWIPSLGGKMDMVPGAVNRLVLEADREGTFRGACAEFCGLAHTLMEFDVVVMAPDAFDEWLTQQSRDAVRPSGSLEPRGLELFLQNGCGACHRIGGTAADGSVGPDLTHVGSRLSIAAGTLPSDVGPMAGWISHPAAIKNGVLMPPYPMLDSDELVAIATYLESLE